MDTLPPGAKEDERVLGAARILVDSDPRLRNAAELVGRELVVGDLAKRLKAYADAEIEREIAGGAAF